MMWFGYEMFWYTWCCIRYGHLKKAKVIVPNISPNNTYTLNIFPYIQNL